MNKKYKKTALVSLIAGYILATSFVILMLLNIPGEEEEVTPIVRQDVEFTEHNTTVVEEKIVYVDRDELPPVEYIDHLDGVIVADRGEVVTAVVRDGGIIGYDHINSIDDAYIPSRITNHNGNHRGIVDHDIRGGHVASVGSNVDHRYRGNRVDVVDDAIITGRDEVIVDPGLLDRRILELEEKDKIGLDTRDGIAFDRLSPVTDSSDAELGDIEDFKDVDVSADGGYGVGKGGQLYAYNFPSQGVGAGVGSGGVGAGSGAGAGLSAGVGEGVLGGESVPTLGGVGTYTVPGEGAEAGPGEGSGVGGLVSGAGAGCAAGLYTGRATEILGTGPGMGSGTGGSGRGTGKCNYDHLPRDGALHIMMHVDGSGSILNTRKQLDIMKDTLLKDALLPYYNNNEDLYNKRVTIVDGNGERTLQFFADAAKKENVLAVVFQDEAQPAYHLPTFNKKPQDHYSRDLGKLKASLNGYGGVYRGVMFQVDRGKTFAKSFKEFVESAWRGEGYLKSSNLKKYYRDNNNHHIKNKDGVVFSDEYHAKDSGDPQYYLNLIFNASKKVGLDLNIYGAGLKDGRYNK